MLVFLEECDLGLAWEENWKCFTDGIYYILYGWDRISVCLGERALIHRDGDEGRVGFTGKSELGFCAV